jgi:hypothetical protein
MALVDGREESRPDAGARRPLIRVAVRPQSSTAQVLFRLAAILGLLAVVGLANGARVGGAGVERPALRAEVGLR